VPNKTIAIFYRDMPSTISPIAFDIFQNKPFSISNVELILIFFDILHEDIGKHVITRRRKVSIIINEM